MVLRYISTCDERLFVERDQRPRFLQFQVKFKGYREIRERNGNSKEYSRESCCWKDTDPENFLDKEKIIETWKQGVCGSDRKYIKARNCAFKNVNELVWEWFTIARSKNIPITGRLIQEKGMKMALKLQMDGWKHGENVTV